VQQIQRELVPVPPTIAPEHPEFIKQKVASHSGNVSKGYGHQCRQQMTAYPNNSQIDNRNAAPDCTEFYEL